jgi:putative DNA primase/helicase
MLNYSHSTQTDSRLAISVKEPLSALSSSSCQTPTSEWICGSEIAPTLTQKWLTEIEDPDEIATLLNWTYYNHTRGWYVKSVNPKTGQFANYGQFKPSSPLILNEKPQKYFSFPKGKGTEPIFAPMVLELWMEIADRHNVPINNEDIDESRVDLGFWSWVLNHPELPLTITEGAKKAGCLISHGEITIALSGVWNGQIGKGKALHPALIPFISPGRPVKLVFDSDVTVKPQVEAALIQFGRLCKQQKAEVFIVKWDLNLGKGIDDLIVLNGEEKFQEIMSNPVSYRQWLQSLEVQVTPSSPPKTQKPPSPDVLARSLKEKYQDKWIWDNEHKTWLEYEKKKVGGSLNIDKDNQSSSFVQGVWTPVEDLYISVQVNLILEARGVTGYGASYLRNIVELLRHQLYCHEWNENKNLLPFLDGVYDSTTGKFTAHAPGNRLTWVLPRNYTLLDTSWGSIDRWLDEAVAGDMYHKRLLLCFAAAVLRRRSDLQKFLHIIGLGGSGKSTLMNLLIAVVGQQNTASLDLDALNEKDAIADLFGKVLLVFPDQDSCGKQVSNFKKITGQDLLRGRKLYKDAFHFRFDGMVAITSNQPIFHAGSGRWLTRRAIMVPFKQIVGDHQVRDLEKEFEHELSAFTHHLLSIPETEIEMVLRGVAGGQKLSSTLWESQVRSDGLASWVNEHLIHDPLAKTQIGSNAREWNDDYNPAESTLFGSYCWSSRNTLRSPLTKENFSANLLELLTATLGWQVEKKKSNGTMVISGVRLRANGDSDRLTIEEQLQGGLLGRDQGDLEEDLKSLPYIIQGDQGGLENQISQLEKEKESLLERLRLLESKNTVIDRVSSTPPSPSLVSPTQTEQELSVSLSPTVEPSCEVSLDYSTYPHRTSDDERAKKNQAERCKEKMLSCTTSEQLAQFKSEGGFSENEIKWVYHRLLTPSEREKIKEAASLNQLNLLEQVNYDWNELIAAINAEIKRLGWTTEQAKEYLIAKYNKRSRQLLDDEEIVELWQDLRKM